MYEAIVDGKEKQEDKIGKEVNPSQSIPAILLYFSDDDLPLQCGSRRSIMEQGRSQR